MSQSTYIVKEDHCPKHSLVLINFTFFLPLPNCNSSTENTLYQFCKPQTQIICCAVWIEICLVSKIEYLIKFNVVTTSKKAQALFASVFLIYVHTYSFIAAYIFRHGWFFVNSYSNTSWPFWQRFLYLQDMLKPLHCYYTWTFKLTASYVLGTRCPFKACLLVVVQCKICLQCLLVIYKLRDGFYTTKF